MPWFRVDDGLPSSKAVLKIPRRYRASAIGLWTLAGAWSASELLDGYVPEYALEELCGTPALATRLVECGLWEETQSGWSFMGWRKYQPTREQVMADRDRERERKRAWRESRKRPAGTMTGRTQGHRPESGHPDPTRPDPTTSPTEMSSGAANTTSLSKAKRSIQRPGDFQPTQAHIDLAAERGVNLRDEWAKFCDYCDANGKTYRDWNAALRNWIRNSRPTPGTKSRVQEHLDLATRLRQEDAPRIGN